MNYWTARKQQRTDRKAEAIVRLYHDMLMDQVRAMMYPDLELDEKDWQDIEAYYNGRPDGVDDEHPETKE